MSPFSRRLAAVPALSLLMAGTAPADAAPAPDGMFSPASIAGGLLRGVVSYARMIADIRYGALEVDGPRGALVMRDLQIAGIGQYERCRVTLGRFQISGFSFWGPESRRLHIDLSDLAIAANCFGPNAAMIAMVTGGDAIPVRTLTADIASVSGSGALMADIDIVSPGIALIEGSVDFDYVSIFSPDFFEKLAENPESDPFAEMTPEDFAPEPPGFDENGNPLPADGGTIAPPGNEPTFGLRGTLRAADLSVENLGVWERLQPILPPDAKDPQSLQALVTAPPGSKLNETQQALAGVLAGFMAKPGRVTAEIRPKAPIAFDTTPWTSPEDALALFPLRLTNALPTPPVALIADPAAGDARAMGLALAEGRGVPQNTREAVRLLEPLTGDAEVALVLARLLAASDPVTAYAHALNAAALGAPDAPAALDRIEAQLPTADILAAQAPADAALPDAAFASVVALRDAALAHEQGDGVPRSYALAWRLASSAAAAGDGAARALMTRLEARFAGAPAWAEARDAASDLAMTDWTGKALAARLADPAAK